MRRAIVLLLAIGALPVASQQALRYPDPDIGEQQLQERLRQQTLAAAGSAVAHDFRFEDRQPGSGLTFVHRVVSDAGKTYKAAHYDHGTGVAVADVDGDRRPDLYFPNQVGANGLYRNLGEGRFEDVTEAAGVAVADRISVGASFADVDNDGDADLFVTTVRGGNVLFENDGHGRFADVTESSGLGYVGHSSGATFLDYDGDGLLDLFVANVGSYTLEERHADGSLVARDDAFDGHLHPDRYERSLLYRNLGGLRFEEVGEQLGLVDEGWSGDAGLVSFEPGRVGLYVLNMQGSDTYWSFGSGRFEDRTAALFRRTPWGAMGIESFDYDGDGDMDLLITDMHSDMTEARDPDQEERKHAFDDARFYQEAGVHLLGNALFRNDGDGPFAEVSDDAGLETYWPWGVSVGDVNADGWEDVFITQSMNYPFRYQINTMRLNEQGHRFVPAEFVLGIEPRRQRRVRMPWFELDCDGADAGHMHCGADGGALTVLGTLGSRSSALVDLDGDGDLDLVTAEFNAEPQLLISDLAQRRPLRWIEIRLQGTASNRDGLGARVEVTAAGRTRVQVLDGKSGYLSQSSTPLYFGVAGAEAVDRVVVRWPSGAEQVLDGPLQVNQTLLLIEPSAGLQSSLSTRAKLPPRMPSTSSSE